MTEESTTPFFGENRSLFSDYYIAERLGDHREWSTDVSEPFQRALELYQANKAALPKMNESQTEKEFIQPILSEVLGYQFDVQHGEKRSGRLNIPDYIFFGDEESLKEAQAHRDEKGKYYAEALALGDAKYWGRSLDGKGVAEKDRLTNANPSFQIVNYLTVTGLDWGILTNGSHWRLYSMKSRSRIDSYFEVDLKRMLEKEDKEQFKYFYHFFRAQAFRKDPETGQNFLGSVFEGSIDYGTRLEGRLKELIFDDVFLTLGKGFTEFRANEARNEKETDESLQEIYQGTLRLLYRLLFILHAESRHLLPLDNRGYWQYSLMNLKKEIADRVDEGIPQSSQSFDVWNDLDSLFRIIDKGDPELNVPRYNGGLFRGDHPKNQFFGEHKVSDKYMVPALELLTREPDPKTGRKRFIDYKSLNVEQLGSIYEGLLEFHLRIANEPLAVVKKRGREVFEPESEVKNPSEVIPKGTLYLQNDKGERKATGSYYTPHYIVEYIVEHTLGPVFEKRAETFENLMEQLEPKYGQYEKLNEKIDEGDRSERTHNKRKALKLEIDSLEKSATETLLSIKICDPAMGSGHFLKEATDKLAEKIITLLAQYPLNPVTNLLSSIRDEILTSLAEQEISIDAEEHLKDTNLIKRMVMKRSIYGVDLNPMAVELAKLSLWLDSFTVGAPLSFLDHHLKTGNSLIGTTVREVKHTLELDEDRQIEAFGGPFTALLTATQLMRDVAQRTDATISEVQESVAKYRDYEEAIKPYKRLLDLWISRHFDNDKAIVLLRQYPDKVIKEVKGEASDLHENYVPVLEQAESQAESKRFFHWELEFPEVFIDLKQSKWLENPGFDMVVGNPPWGSNMSELKDYLKEYYLVDSGELDSHVFFTELETEKLKEDGLLGTITPNTWYYLSDLGNLRSYLLSNTSLEEIIELEKGIFIDARDIVPSITILKKKKNKTSKLVTVKLLKIGFGIGKLKSLENKNFRTIHKVDTELWSEIPDTIFNLRITPAAKNIFNKIDKYSTRLEKKYKPIYGIKTGNNERYISNEKEDERYKPALISGKEIKKYSINWTNNFLDYGPYLAGYRTESVEIPKLLVQYIRKISLKNRLICSLDENGMFYPLNNFSYIIPRNEESNLKFLLSILNSRLMNFYYANHFIDYNIKPKYLEQLPVREIDFSNFDANDNTREPDHLEQRYQNYLADDNRDDLLNFTKTLVKNKVEHRLPLIHDFLAFLAEQMLDFNKEKQRIQSALDPFKFLNKGVGFKKFSNIFSEAIKYGQQLTEGIDIGTVHHDIEDLRLEPEGDKWLLNVHLKHRDPETDWDDWVKVDGNIVRSTQAVYRFELPEEQAHYWQQAFEVLDEFEHNSSGRIFPGGKTSTTHDKLMGSDVPIFDESANIQPLIELREELAEVEENIEKTDWLIDQVVYQLYGLSEEEIRVVEENSI